MNPTATAPAASEVSREQQSWRALHAFCHAGRAATDALLLSVVRPRVRALRDQGIVRHWFFIRYWHGGPHVRLRLSGPDPELVDRAVVALAEEMSTHLTAHPPSEALEPEEFYAAFGLTAAERDSLGWYPHGAVVEQDYEPEYERYGGAVAIRAAEELFQVSSEIAMAAVGGAPSDQARVGIGLELLLGLCDSIFDRPGDGARWLREYAVMWRYLDSTVAGRAEQIRGAAEAAFVADRERLVQRRLVAGTEQAPSVCQHWSAAVARAYTWLRQQDDLTTDPDAVMVSQLHMLSNRMGLSAADEVYLVSVAAHVLTAPGTAWEYFDDGVSAPDRAAHEHSKFRPSMFEEQQPLDPQPHRRSLDFASGAPVAMSEPTDPGLDAPLREVISGRRSHRAGFAGTLKLEDLSALLGYSFGYVGTEGGPGDGLPAQRAVRAFPSAGMAYPTVLRLAAYDVEGLRPAVFEYLPEQHAFQQVAQLPPREALSASSPFFAGESPRIDVSAAPAVLFVAADLRGMRARYGLRTFRFATLELGHVAQNLVLLSGALGLPSAPVGGFFDDQAAALAQLDGYDEVLGYLVPLGAARRDPPSADDDVPSRRKASR